MLQLLDRGMRRVPPHVQIPRELAGTGGAWIAEAAPLPIVNNVFSTVTQSLYKLGVAVALGGQLKTGNLWTAQNRQFRRGGRDQ